jgi:hypothetical protein
MKALLSLVRFLSIAACLVGLVTTSAACETRERVVVRDRAPVERVYVRPQPVVVQERVVVH